MISRLRGTVIMISPQHLTVDVQGVGYAVSVSDERVFLPEQAVDLHVYYHWSQDNGPQLFGFTTVFSRAVFSYVLTCTGCGPKIGLAVLAGMGPEEFVAAIATGDSKALSRVNGIGPKKAELMIMQLKDKVPLLVVHNKSTTQTGLSQITQLSATLSALHYTQPEISAALEFVRTQGSLINSSFDELLRKALSFLAKKL
jgi:holliday junction DNA helicase RuvA